MKTRTRRLNLWVTCKITNKIHIVTMFATMGKIVLIICWQTFIIVITNEHGDDRDIVLVHELFNNHESGSSNVWFVPWIRLSMKNIF